MPHHDTFWKSKLAAFLHDPPEKALDIAWHKQRAEAHQSGHDLNDAEFRFVADHTAAAADRLPWPTYQHLECAFDGKLNHFKHPLGSASLTIPPFASADQATAKAWASRPTLDHVASGADYDRAQFIAYWRLWRWWASDLRAPKDSRMAFLPADTRLPDHTIWAHNSLVSAFQGCVEEDGECRPAFLLMSLGPVQDFIAAARRTLDLWSGSYLLSYLTGVALRHLALRLGPDQVIFPNLCGQPIFDLLLKDEIWSKAFVQPGADAPPLWDGFKFDGEYSRRRLLTPSLPNRFLALVPASKARQIAEDVAKTVHATFEEIGKAVWKLAKTKLDPLHPLAEHEARFFEQAMHHLDIAWQVLPWPEMPDEAIGLVKHLPKSDPSTQAGLEIILHLAAKMPKNHRDVRNFDCARFPDGLKNGWKDKSRLTNDAKLDNPGAAWSALFALLNWQLDGVKQTRAWEAWSTGRVTTGLMKGKDTLTGKEEGILNLASERTSDDHVKALGKTIGSEHLFKKGDILGAITLIKRLWPTAWLIGKHDFRASDFRFPDTRNIADGQPFPDKESGDDDNAPESGNGYFSVIAFDGDDMGKWLSGTHPKMPRMKTLLADYEMGGRRLGAVKYLAEQQDLAALLEHPRPLNPSFHLQFSEMLGTFSNVCARRVVEAFDGCLIYSGGDDVLAMLPSGNALACARALRAAFLGTTDLNKVKGAWEVDRENNHREKNADLSLFNVTQPGFIQLHSDNYLVMEGEPKNYPAIVPGPAAECSVGIAIAHFKAPLQDVVREAQKAEKRAKKELGRGAVAVSLCKRSGEITEWGTKWESGGLALYGEIARLLDSGELTNKFPHRVCQLLEPYLVASSGLMKSNQTMRDAADFDAAEIIRKEFSYAVSRQSAAGSQKNNDGMLLPLLDAYLKNHAAAWHKLEEARRDKDQAPPITQAQELLTSIIGLCTTVAFAQRTKPDHD